MYKRQAKDVMDVMDVMGTTRDKFMVLLKARGEDARVSCNPACILLKTAMKVVFNKRARFHVSSRLLAVRRPCVRRGARPDVVRRLVLDIRAPSGERSVRNSRRRVLPR